MRDREQRGAPTLQGIPLRRKARRTRRAGLRSGMLHDNGPLRVDPHPSLRLTVFPTAFPAPLGELPTPATLRDLLRADAAAPIARDEAVRAAVRDMLRHGGYKPTGRGKPA